MGEPITEPPDGASVLIGEPPLQVFVTRDDAAAVGHADQSADGAVTRDARWWPPDSEATGPYRWAQLTELDPDAIDDDLPSGLNRQVVERFYPQGEVAKLINEAVAAAGVTPIGEHLIEAGGWCRTCTSQHSTVEIARLEDRLEEDAHHGG